MTSSVHYRSDYQPSAYLILKTQLVFELFEDETLVRTRLEIEPQGPSSATTSLRLHGRGLELKSLKLNEFELAAEHYLLDDEGLTLLGVLPSETFILETCVRILPQQNTYLEGLYRSNGKFCTQCEAEGFRRITYYLDQPDILAEFTTRIEADSTAYPYLLSNGNCIEQGALEDGRHFALWHDPFVKPCYLFALVAGDFDLLEDQFVTCTGRSVALRIFVDRGKKNQCQHAMHSLKQAMAWDERVFGREYDLDIFMLVAVSDFNMGAMENKGLNVFNTKYVLADVDSATDQDFLGVQSVIGHEYFHNWSGNRVTCRDWFQLSLKEGLTVFRDQQFTSDLNSRAVKRIGDVQIIRGPQFSEDAGPMAHPIRPDSYVEMNNFYTVTVYNKGAEVVRMLHTLLGRDGFRRGMDQYFERHDGQAVTCDDFVSAMEDANDTELTQFRHWYSQAGTPQVSVLKEHYDSATSSLLLELAQTCPETPGQTHKEPLHIPFKVGFLAPDGQPQTVCYQGREATEFVLDFTAVQQVFKFDQVPVPVTLSLLRDFSAPVKLLRNITDAGLGFLLAHDRNSFARWDAGQQLMSRAIWEVYATATATATTTATGMLVEAFRTLLTDSMDPALKALAVQLPTVSMLENEREAVDVLRLWRARERIQTTLSEQLRENFESMAKQARAELKKTAPEQASGVRMLANTALRYAAVGGSSWARQAIRKQFAKPSNMTDELAAFKMLVELDDNSREAAINSFYERWNHETLVLDKWLMVQGSARDGLALGRAQSLWEHPIVDHTNPNKVRALLGSFAANTPLFHAEDGSGYRWYGERLLELDRLNPQTTARLAGVLLRWRQYDTQRGEQMRQVLERISGTLELSGDLREIVEKGLSDDPA